MKARKKFKSRRKAKLPAYIKRDIMGAEKLLENREFLKRTLRK